MVVTERAVIVPEAAAVEQSPHGGDSRLRIRARAGEKPRLSVKASSSASVSAESQAESTQRSAAIAAAAKSSARSGGASIARTTRAGVGCTPRGAASGLWALKLLLVIRTHRISIGLEHGMNKY
jgi:hypothetical protein